MDDQRNACQSEAPVRRPAALDPPLPHDVQAHCVGEVSLIQRVSQTSFQSLFLSTQGLFAPARSRALPAREERGQFQDFDVDISLRSATALFPAPKRA